MRHVGPPEDVDVVVRDLAAPVVALVDDHGLPVGLREEIALEVLVSRAGRVGHVHICDPPVRGFVDPREVALHPVPVPQRALVRHRHDIDGAGPCSIRRRADGDRDDPAGRVLEPAVEVLRRRERDPFDRQQVFARFDLDSRLRERGPESGVPVETAVHLFEPVPPPVDRKVRAQETARHVVRLVQEVAAAAAVVPHRKLGMQPRHEAVQVGP